MILRNLWNLGKSWILGNREIFLYFDEIIKWLLFPIRLVNLGRSWNSFLFWWNYQMAVISDLPGKSWEIVVGEVSYCPNQWCSYGRLVSIIVMMVFILDFYDTLITWVDPVWSQMICWCSSIAVVIQLMVIPSSSEKIFDCAIGLSGLVEGHLIVSNKIE